MRHCARSTPLDIFTGAKGFYDFDNYTSKPHQPFPAWTVGTYECLPRGNELIRQFSGNISLTFPRPVQVVADSCCDRDRDTADDFIVGARLNPATTDYRTNTVVFGSMDTFPGFNPPFGACRGDVATQARNADITANFHSVKKPDGLDKMLASLQENVLGKGAAPPLQDIPNILLATPPTQLGASTVVVGGVPIASAFVEAFLMQEAGGYPVAWDTLPPKELNDLLALHIYNRALGDSRAKGWARVSHASMLASIVQFLTNDNPSDNQTALTKVFVGHDSDLDSLATLLDLTWDAAPFPTNSTTPGSVLRFDLDDDAMVTISYQYTSFGVGIDGAAHTVPVFRPQADGTQGIAFLGLSSLAHLSTEVYNEDCIASPLP
jgi:hypothetical protein